MKSIMVWHLEITERNQHTPHSSLWSGQLAGQSPDLCKILVSVLFTPVSLALGRVLGIRRFLGNTWECLNEVL